MGSLSNHGVAFPGISGTKRCSNCWTDDLKVGDAALVHYHCLMGSDGLLISNLDFYLHAYVTLRRLSLESRSACARKKLKENFLVRILKSQILSTPLFVSPSISLDVCYQRGK